MEKRSILALALGLFMVSNQSMAISEQNYAQDMATEVMPFYSTGVRGSFSGKNGVPIQYIKFENPDEVGAIVIVNGRTESYALYAEPIYDLAQQGYSIYAYDHRGQGYSGRMLSDPQKSYIDDFSYYIDDLKTFIDAVVNAKAHKKRYILAHSMGGNVAAQFGMQYPDAIDAYAFSSPMFGINTSPYPNLIARLIVEYAMLTGGAENYAKGQLPYDPSATFAENVLTTSELRWDTRAGILNNTPALQMGGPTNQWVSQTFQACDDVIANASSFKPRAIIFQAGEDKVVVPGEENVFCSKAPHCSIAALYPKGYHELIREQDYIRTDLYERVVKFFSELKR